MTLCACFTKCVHAELLSYKARHFNKREANNSIQVFFKSLQLNGCYEGERLIDFEIFKVHWGEDDELAFKSASKFASQFDVTARDTMINELKDIVFPIVGVAKN